MEKSRSFYIEESLEFSENHWFKDGSEEMKFKKNPGWSVYRDGVASGRVVAGNLGTILLLAGTKYFPDLTDSILFTAMVPTGEIIVLMKKKHKQLIVILPR